MNERGLTIQIVTVSAVMALGASAAGIVIYNIVADESEDIEETVEEVSDVTLFTEEPDGEEPDGEEPDEGSDEEEEKCADGEVENDQGECEIEECTATQIRNNQGECEEEVIINRGLPVKALDSGDDYTCAIIATSSLGEDAVWCWGLNDRAQLSEATGRVSARPVRIPGLRNIRALSVGADHACAIVRDSEFSTAADAVECWGNNENLQSGQPWQTSEQILSQLTPRPARVGRVTGAQAVSAGNDHTCVIKVNPLANLDSTVLECWGDPLRGTLGAEAEDVPMQLAIPGGPLTQRNIIEQFRGKDLKALAAGDNFTCVIVGGDQPDGSADTVWCWGDNAQGQLGDNAVSLAESYSADPIEIAGLAGAKAISVGSNHACAIIGGDQTAGSADTVWCWGDNTQGQLGDTATGSRSAPAEISDFRGARSVATGRATTCIVTSTNSYKCVGNVARDGSDDGSNQPDVSLIAPGKSHVCFAYADGNIKCFGDNSNAQIGRTPVVIPYHIPNKIPDTSGARRVSVGADIGCFITSSDTLKCWGSNSYRQLDVPDSQDDNFRANPVEISGLTGATDISNTYEDSYCVIVSNGNTGTPENTVKCRGSNRNGALGQDPASMQQVTRGFVDVTQVSNPLAVSNAGGHACAIAGGSTSDSSADDNTIWCWGNNGGGQIISHLRSYQGLRIYVAPEEQRALINFINFQNRPRSLAEEITISLLGAKAISAGFSHTCAIADKQTITATTGTPTGEDTVWCWGGNDFGQLGMPIDQLVSPSTFWPRQIPGFNGAKAISAGNEYSCAITVDDTVKCWGRNNQGQLGTAPFGAPDAVGVSIPIIDVPGLKRATAISAGESTVCAIAAVLDGANEPTTQDAVYCWGNNLFGLAGAPYTVSDSPEKVSFSATPRRIQGITDPRGIDVGPNQACAIAADLDDSNNPTGEDAIYCWGDFNAGARGTLLIPGTGIFYWNVNSYPEPRRISGL